MNDPSWKTQRDHPGPIQAIAIHSRLQRQASQLAAQFVNYCASSGRLLCITASAVNSVNQATFDDCTWADSRQTT